MLALAGTGLAGWWLWRGAGESITAQDLAGRPLSASERSPDVPPAPSYSRLPAQPTRAAATETDSQLPAKVLAALKGATVYVKLEAGRLSATGSGFLFKTEGETGYVVTNHHVIDLPPRSRLIGQVRLVFWSGTRKERNVPAELVASDAGRDLAILKVTDFPDLPAPIDLGQRVELVETMTVWMVGFPLGDALSVTEGNPAVTISKGSVSSLRRNDRDEMSVVQIDGELNPGSSGGPVVDSAGRLVGVAVAKMAGTRIGMAIPPSELTQMLRAGLGGHEPGSRPAVREHQPMEKTATSS
jgi:S1-C subfamily serine protease